jgi:beta-lactamase regulating signal transducer with metallopeptidase domain
MEDQPGTEDQPDDQPMAIAGGVSREVELVPDEGQQESANVRPSESPDEHVVVTSEENQTALRTEEVPETVASSRALSLASSMRVAVRPWLPQLVVLWLAGVAICLLRPLFGMWWQWRVRHYGVSAVPEAIGELLTRTARRMKISRVVRIAQSSLVHVPVVLGYVRPLILLPVGVAAGLTPSQLEAVLAHELGHILRHDWLMNALQIVVETMLFYHPAVWWVSRRLRDTRELCCDDLTIGLVSDRAVLARALLILEELRQQSAVRMPAPSLAATGGQLLMRIRRLLPVDPASPPGARNWRAGFVLLAAMGCVGGFTLLAMPPDGRQKDQTRAVASEPAHEGNDDSGGTSRAAVVTSPADVEDAEDPGEATAASADSTDNPPVKPVDEEETPASEPKAKEPAKKGILSRLGSWLGLGTGNDEEIRTAGERVVRVVDEQGNPIQGAQVQFDFEGKGETFMAGSFKTNARGEARTGIPERARKVDLTVTADGFNKLSTEELATGTSVITLTRGTIVRVRPVDEKKQLLKDSVPLLAGTHTWGREFTFNQKEGIFVSPAVEAKRKLLRVACAQANGPFLFSDPIDITKAKPGDDGVFEVVLKPGVRLEGRLDDSVPRPVTEGYAVVTIVEGEDGTIRRGENFAWQDFAVVRPDGTFTFESLPGGGHAQIHVMVDGFLSRNWSPAETVNYLRQWKLADEKYLEETREWIDGFSMRPQFFALDRPTVEAMIPCEPAGGCDFLLLDPGMKPVSGADVSCNPNVVFVANGCQLPGCQLWTSLMVDGLRTGGSMYPLTRKDNSPHGREAGKFFEWIQRSFLGTKSDEGGRVKIRNVPGGSRETFHISAKGYVLPLSPLADESSQFGEDSDEDRSRYLVVEFVAGETTEKTIYLERKQRTTRRELTVVNRTGKPIPQVSLAVSEICVGKKNWQTWSVQRFGPLPRGETDRLGRLVLKLPSDVEKVPVTRVRLGVIYHGSRHRQERTNEDDEERDDRRYVDELFISGGTVDVPLKADNGVIALLTNPNRPNTPVATHQGIVRYGPLESILPGKTRAEWLAKMAKEPSMAVLRALLKETKIKYPEPVDLLSDARRMAPRPGSKEKGGVDVVTTADDTFTIVETHVKPEKSDLVHDSRLSPLPECAFVFDRQGELIAVVGGEFGRTQSNSPDSIDVLSLGPAEDWFIRVSRFETNRGFDHVTTYYRVADPIVPSFRIYHETHSGSWSWGPQKTVRYGFLGYDFPRTRDDDQRDRELLVSPAGGRTVSGFVWEGDRNRFIGPAASILRGQRIYEVDTDFSTEFEPLAPTADQLVVWGGRYDYGYTWELVVPEGTELVAKLTFPNADGQPQAIQRHLGSGRQDLQVYFQPREGDKQKLQMQFCVSGKKKSGELEKLFFNVPGEPGAPPESRNPSPPAFRIIEPDENALLLDRPLKSASDTARLELRYSKPAGK